MAMFGDDGWGIAKEGEGASDMRRPGAGALEKVALSDLYDASRNSRRARTPVVYGMAQSDVVS